MLTLCLYESYIIYINICTYIPWMYSLRTVRWSMAIVIPAFGYLKHEFERRVWSKVVKEENAKVHLPS